MSSIRPRIRPSLIPNAIRRGGSRAIKFAGYPRFGSPSLQPNLATIAKYPLIRFLSTSRHPSLTMSDNTYVAPLHPRPGDRSREDGREFKLLHFIYDQPNRDEIQGNPQKVLDLIDEFAQTYHFMNIGPDKGKFITEIIAERKPEVMIELGGYVGYSAILFGDAVRRAGGKRYYSLELNPEYAAIANMLLDLAGLRDFVRIIVGRSDLSLHKLFDSGEVKQVEVLFIDHYKPAYTTDLKLCEQLGKIVPEVSVVIADNVLYPGNPPYLEYVRSTVEQKREAAKKGPERTYNREGIPDRTVQSFLGADATPQFDIIGNPNLIYESKLVKPETTRDAIEVTRCVGVQE